MKKAEFLITELYKSFGNLDLSSSAVRHQTMIAVNNKLFNLSNEQFDEIMKKYNSKTNTIQRLTEMGNKRFLQSNSLFCFGDRQTLKTTNMILKSLLKFFEKPHDKYTIVYVASTFASGQPIIQKIKDIAEKFGWEIAREAKYDITLIIDGMYVFFTIRTTEDSVRGMNTDFVIIDHANYINNPNLCRALLMSEKPFIIGGDSFYA